MADDLSKLSSARNAGASESKRFHLSTGRLFLGKSEREAPRKCHQLSPFSQPLTCGSTKDLYERAAVHGKLPSLFPRATCRRQLQPEAPAAISFPPPPSLSSGLISLIFINAGPLEGECVMPVSCGSR
ncbi:hypothetical protein CDAR_123411 [Caerostris darwini]|uniref:Uncharacterized protein n=1 Tax=Caerostris darwini TaxID=1538125 RepID=A0AAV4WWT3_9ARAC|nr:hypothetical protein CDAR_123411 [Caerostris darwini]